MNPSLDLIRNDLIRTLGHLSRRPAVDRAVRDQADALAREVERTAAADGVSARVWRAGAADYRVTVSGPAVFAREFGSRQAEADPIVGAAIARLKGSAP